MNNILELEETRDKTNKDGNISLNKSWNKDNGSFQNFRQYRSLENTDTTRIRILIQRNGGMTQYF